MAARCGYQEVAADIGNERIADRLRHLGLDILQLRHRPAEKDGLLAGAARNYTGYCNAEVDKLIDRQSAESDPQKRKKLVWD
jgi:ABC-type transport system substrate-binding protein